MMDRPLLVMKKCIQEFFKKHPTIPPKLTTADWLVTNEVCMQGDDDAFLSGSIVLN